MERWDANLQFNYNGVMKLYHRGQFLAWVITPRMFSGCPTASKHLLIMTCKTCCCNHSVSELLRALKMLWRWWCSQHRWLLLLLMWFMDKTQTTLPITCLAKYLHFCEQVKSESILPSKGVCSPCNINNHLRCMGTIVEVHYKNSVFPTHLHMTFKNPMRKCN